MHSHEDYNAAVNRKQEARRKPMPVYTYRCESCGIQFERHQSFTDSPLKTCPECRKKALKKVITPTKIIFKGSGFYATDHKSPSGSATTSSKKSDTESKPSSSE
jgi:putative FmdB family regulatory protein